MTPKDYKNWVALQREVEARRNAEDPKSVRTRKTEEEEAIEDQLFEAVSKRSWTDVLLQTIKVGFPSCNSECTDVTRIVMVVTSCCCRRCI